MRRPTSAPLPVIALCATWVLGLCGAGVALASCGGGARLAGDVYRDEEALYRIGPRGSDWHALSVEDQNDLAFHDEDAGAIVQVNATCDPTSDVPLTSLTNHLVIGFTEREIRSQRIVDMDRREALRTHLTARVDGVPREFLFYVMKKDDCVYDLALIAPPGTPFEAALVEFEPFVAGFSTEVP